MKKICFVLFLLIASATHAQLYSFILASDTTLFAFNPSTRDSIQLNKLPKTLYNGMGTGNAYSVTATPAAITMGTTSPTVTIAKAGTYLIMWNVRTDYSAATIAVSRTMTYKVRRTNNTATDVFTSGFATPVITLLTFSGPDISRQFVYTATAGDILQLWASISTIPTAGAVTVPEANIITLRLY